LPIFIVRGAPLVNLRHGTLQEPYGDHLRDVFHDQRCRSVAFKDRIVGVGLDSSETGHPPSNGIQASLMTPSEKNEAFAEINRILATIA
jgi:hypothetical protein